MMDVTFIQQKIYELRGYRIMLDYDLAVLYDVGTKRLNEQVKRNISRFPADFMFRLTTDEWDEMRSQIATASEFNTIIKENVIQLQKKRNTSSTPFAFTEHGVTMLAGVLRSERAIAMSIAVVRAFVQLKELAIQQNEFSHQLDKIFNHLGIHDAQLSQIYKVIEKLLAKKKNEKKWEERTRIGYKL